MALNIENFIKRRLKLRKTSIKVIALDEPSLGMNDKIQFSDLDMFLPLLWLPLRAETGADVEIHPQSPLKYKLICETPINVMGLNTLQTLLI
jgi:5-methyltetrahydropteroyltriglutamate--homocysteine methyltransferase